MSTKRTPPPSKKCAETYLKPSSVHSAQESDTASECIGSDADHSGQLNVTRRYKRKHDESTLCEIREMVADMQNQQKTLTSRFDEEMKKMSQQNDEIKQSIQYMSDKYDEILRQLQQTKTENCAMKNHVQLLEQKVELLERHMKASTLELKNVPQAPSENTSTLVSMVKNIGTVLSVQVSENDIQNIYRPRKTINQPSPIIIEFSSTSVKDNLIKATKIFNRESKVKLNTSHINVPGDAKPIYLAESLTTTARRLYYLAREFTRNHKNASCWTAYGKVYIRPREGDASKLIVREEDLSALKPL